MVYGSPHFIILSVVAQVVGAQQRALFTVHCYHLLLRRCERCLHRKHGQLAECALCSSYRPLSRRLDRCDRVIQNESRDPFGGNVYYVTMQITFLTRKFRNGERNLHCDVVHITTKWVSSLTLDCNGVFAIKAYTLWSDYEGNGYMCCNFTCWNATDNYN